MKYSIRGSLKTGDGTAIVDVINDFNLWRLFTDQSTNDLNENIFLFEVWISTLTDKNNLYQRLKTFVDQYANNSHIDWHECTHDEPISKPCVIIDEYRV